MKTSDLLKNKKITDLSREELETVATEIKVEFTAETSDEDLQKVIGAAIETFSVSKKKVKVKFLLSPTGKFGLAYNIGDEITTDGVSAQELIDAEYAVLVK